jgi:hypothetical protein
VALSIDNVSNCRGMLTRFASFFKIVGIDNVEYAKLLPVPLTTVHLACREIGHAAISAMLERIKDPNMLARDILVDCRLIVRAYCGSASTLYWPEVRPDLDPSTFNIESIVFVLLPLTWTAIHPRFTSAS